ncbi:MAG TPA: pitrilysin family protein [Longimicrobiaceae bacterium]|nr:pitrilysin family protein [Longimicrobiaceae bacterium]
MAPEISAVLPRPRPGTPPVPTVPRAERFQLENGLRVVVVRRGDLPQVFARLVVPAGSAADPVGAPGTASLTGALLLEGTRSRSAIELHERIDSLGAALHNRVGHDFAEVDISLLSETLEEGLGLMADIVTFAAFPAREIERLRAETVDAIEARFDEPANVADDRAAEALFGTDHPYGCLPIGTVESVNALSRDTLITFHEQRYRPGGSVLVLAGDVGTADLRPVLEHVLAEWTGGVPPIEYPPVPDRPLGAGTLDSVLWEDAAQTEIRFAGLGMPRSSEHWIPSAVANYVLGGSTITGRLGANLREDKGWTYGIRCGFSVGVQAGGWTIETAVDESAAGAALDEIEGELDRMISYRLDDEELERAKEALVLSLPRAFETPGRIVARLATVEAYGLSLDYWETFPAHVRAVDADAVAEMARRHFSPDGLARVTVGPGLAAPTDDS